MNAMVGGRLGIFSIGAALLAGLAILAGCDSGTPEKRIKAIIKSINDCNGKRLANLYAMYQEQSAAFKGPPDEKAFKKFIAGVEPAQLEAMGISTGTIDALFVSERDGQPFDIRYGASWVPGANANQAVIFESQGSAGRVAVYMTGPQVVEVDPVDVAALKKGERDTWPARADAPHVSPNPSPGSG